MKIQYFSETDTLAIELTSKSVASTDAITDDLILDYGEQGKIVAITIDHYSRFHSGEVRCEHPPCPPLPRGGTA
ncbi:MAG: DUF2283 domain-containing protein [Cyanobacteriota bacterium]|nr:DUF2283 domain-containing protein [Cyanobacteriota bacterium]